MFHQHISYYNLSNIHVYLPIQYIMDLSMHVKISQFVHFYIFCRFIRLRRIRGVNQEAVLLAICSQVFTKKVIIFRYF